MRQRHRETYRGTTRRIERLYTGGNISGTESGKGMVSSRGEIYKEQKGGLKGYTLGEMNKEQKGE